MSQYSPVNGTRPSQGQGNNQPNGQRNGTGNGQNGGAAMLPLNAGGQGGMNPVQGFGGGQFGGQGYGRGGYGRMQVGYCAPGYPCAGMGGLSMGTILFAAMGAVTGALIQREMTKKKDWVVGAAVGALGGYLIGGFVS